MTRRASRDAGQGEARLLELWNAPGDAGQPIGCVATSFTFSAPLFEEECLARFAGIESDPDAEGSVWLIEREERLAALACATALVDVRHCRGRRSLRWDLVPVRVPGAALHAKVVLLAWAHRVRLIVTSANLTEDGYRRNQEVAGILDYGPDAAAPRACLVDALGFLGDVLRHVDAGPAAERCSAFLDDVARRASRWGRAGSGAVQWVATGAGRAPALEQVRAAWRARTAERPHAATVVSPFFDPPERPDNPPARALWSLLRQRGPAKVTYCVTAAEPVDGAVHVHAPGSLERAKPARAAAVSVFRRVPEELAVGDDAVHRPLHAKAMLLESAGLTSVMVGSSNFTSAGMGVASRPNLEANLLYLARPAREHRRASALRAAIVATEEIPGEPALWRWKPLRDECEAVEGVPALPATFARATYGRDERGAHLLLVLHGEPPAGWAVFAAEEDLALLDEARWRSRGSPREIRLPWDESEAPPSGLEVAWDGAPARAWWPVHVQDGGALPAPAALRSLDLLSLIRLLTSARPLHQVLAALQRRAGSDRPTRDPDDPLRRVDTHAFLIQRVRRVSWALRGLRERLEEPCYTVASLRWRLEGPVGPFALARALREGAGRAGKGTEGAEAAAAERAFLLAELALELALVRPRAAPGALAAREVRAAIARVAETIATQARAVPTTNPGIASYVAQALDRVRWLFTETEP